MACEDPFAIRTCPSQRRSVRRKLSLRKQLGAAVDGTCSLPWKPGRQGPDSASGGGHVILSLEGWDDSACAAGKKDIPPQGEEQIQTVAAHVCKARKWSLSAAVFKSKINFTQKSDMKKQSEFLRVKFFGNLSVYPVIYQNLFQFCHFEWKPSGNLSLLPLPSEIHNYTSDFFEPFHGTQGVLIRLNCDNRLNGGIETLKPGGMCWSRRLLSYKASPCCTLKFLQHCFFFCSQCFSYRYITPLYNYNSPGDFLSLDL